MGRGDRFRKWAESIGPLVYKVIDQLLKSCKVEEQGTPERLEKTCAKALSVITVPRYKDIKLILEHYQGEPDQEASFEVNGSLL